MEGIPARILLFVKHVFLAFARCFRKIICIAQRRKQKDEGDPTSVLVISGPPAAASQQQTTSNDVWQHPGNFSHQVQKDDDALHMEDWNSWDSHGFEPTQMPPVDPLLSSNNEIQEEEPTVDFFKDMEPTVKVKKVYVKKKSAAPETSNRLAMDQDLEFKVSGDLDMWEDDEGWEGDDADDIDIDETKVLREAQKQRRLERQNRAKQQKANKSGTKQHEKLALRVS